MGRRKIERLKKVILRRASDVVLYELKDPRIGFLTLSKVDLSEDLRHATLYYSLLGSEAEKSKTAHALEDARGYIQKAVAATLRTRVTPQIRFQFDASIEGSMRVSRLIDEAVARDEEARLARGGVDAVRDDDDDAAERAADRGGGEV